MSENWHVTVCFFHLYPEYYHPTRCWCRSLDSPKGVLEKFGSGSKLPCSQRGAVKSLNDWPTLEDGGVWLHRPQNHWKTLTGSRTGIKHGGNRTCDQHVLVMKLLLKKRGDLKTFSPTNSQSEPRTSSVQFSWLQCLGSWVTSTLKFYFLWCCSIKPVQIIVHTHINTHTQVSIFLGLWSDFRQNISQPVF